MKNDESDKLTVSQSVQVAESMGSMVAMLTASMHITDDVVKDRFVKLNKSRVTITTFTEFRTLLRNLAKFMLDELRDYDVRSKSPKAPPDAETEEVREALKLLTAYKYVLVLDDHILGNIEMRELPEYLRNSARSIEKHIAEAN